MRRFLVPREVLEDRGGDGGGGRGSAAPPKKQARIEDLRKVVTLPRSQMAADTAELLRLKRLLSAFLPSNAGPRQEQQQEQPRAGQKRGAADGGGGACSASGSGSGGGAQAGAEAAEALRQLSCYVLSPE
jgi:hypothetical protein